MSSETDHPRQRTVAELLAEHGDAGATGRRRRRRAPDELPEDTAPDPGNGSGATAWRPSAAPPDTLFPQQDRAFAAPPEQGGRRRRAAVEPEPWNAPRREASPAGIPAGGTSLGDLPVRDLPVRDLPVRDMPGRDVPGRDVQGWDTPGRDTPGREAPSWETPGRESSIRPPVTAWALPAEPAAPPAPRRPEPPSARPPADRLPLAGRPQVERPQIERELPTEQLPRFRGAPVLPDTVTGPLEQQRDTGTAASAGAGTDERRSRDRRADEWADTPDADTGPDDADGGPPTMLGAPPAVDAGPPTQAAAFVPDFDDFDDRPAGLGPDPEPDLDGEPDPGAEAGPQTRSGRRLGRVAESAGQAWAVVLLQWVGGAVGGAVLWVLFRFLWRSLPVVALAAAVLVTVGLVVVVRALLRNNDLRTTMFAVLVGLLLTVSPAILVLLGR